MDLSLLLLNEKNLKTSSALLSAAPFSPPTNMVQFVGLPLLTDIKLVFPWAVTSENEITTLNCEGKKGKLLIVVSLSSKCFQQKSHVISFSMTSFFLSCGLFLCVWLAKFLYSWPWTLFFLSTSPLIRSTSAQPAAISVPVPTFDLISWSTLFRMRMVLVHCFSNLSSSVWFINRHWPWMVSVAELPTGVTIQLLRRFGLNIFRMLKMEATRQGFLLLLWLLMNFWDFLGTAICQLVSDSHSPLKYLLKSVNN